MSHKYDIIIVGAGIVGLAMAGALSKTELNIAIIDRKLPLENFVTEEPSTPSRVSALTLASQKFLEKIGAWELIPSEKISIFRKMQVWDAIGNGDILFDSHEISESELGYILENNMVQTALYKQLKSSSNITFIAPAEIITINQSDLTKSSQQITITLNNQQTFSTQLLIGADGANSKVRELAEIEIKTADYGHSALICNVQTSLSHQQTAWQRFLAAGPLAFLPLTNPQECSIVWSTDPAEIEHLSQLTDHEFKEKLAIAFEQRLGSIETVSKRAIFPLQMRHTKEYIKPHLALIGDAAHTIHPLAGQGLNLGLEDANCLAHLIIEAQMHKKDFGSWSLLRRYERWRKSENVVMMAFVGMVKQAFSKGPTPLRSMANLGLNATSKFLPLKKFFMRKAIGLHKELV